MGFCLFLRQESNCVYSVYSGELESAYSLKKLSLRKGFLGLSALCQHPNIDAASAFAVGVLDTFSPLPSP